MRGFWVLLLVVPLAAQRVPNEYIVELDGAPAIAGAKGKARRALSEVGAEQRRVRSLLPPGAEVLDSVGTVANALIVRIPDQQAALLEAVPGVAHVYPVEQYRRLLDHALPIHDVPYAWQQVGGMERAGAGVKIGILDTGIDVTHPGFQDGTLPVPEGFPKVNKDSDRVHTNNKVIVARAYPDSLNPEGSSAGDREGHGTSVAMAAAGVRVETPLGTISGVAPGAWLGNYKVFPDGRETAPSSLILRALDDAVADGMDIINLSLGSLPAQRPSTDVLVRAIERAAAAGAVVVVAAGNAGPDPNTIVSPATASSAISVGNSYNSRIIAARFTIEDLPPFPAYPGSGPNSRTPISGPLKDVVSLDPSGLACEDLPPGSFEGAIVLILRGQCLFEIKINNAARAGAAGAIVYTDADRPDPITMSVGSATLPAALLSYEDGMRVKRLLGENADRRATIDFSRGAVPVDPNRLESGSSRGPNVDGEIKPDLSAVGTSLLTAVPTSLYAPGYALETGTSLSAPVAAGAAAVLKAARPGLSVERYRSLLINSAAPLVLSSGLIERVQAAGAGILNLSSALAGTAAAYPTSVSFGYTQPPGEVLRSLTVTNLQAEEDLFSLSVTPIEGAAVPSLGAQTLRLAPNTSATVEVRFLPERQGATVAQGFIRIRGTRTDAELRVPYWHAVPSPAAQHLTLLDPPLEGRPRSQQTIYFRITDPAGVPLLNLSPQVVVSSGGGSVDSVTADDLVYPGTYAARIRLGPAAGANVFAIQAGDLRKEVTVTGTSQTP